MQPTINGLFVVLLGVNAVQSFIFQRSSSNRVNNDEEPNFLRLRRPFIADQCTRLFAQLSLPSVEPYLR